MAELVGTKDPVKFWPQRFRKTGSHGDESEQFYEHNAVCKQ
jgi:hypothetical protein